MMIPDIQFSVLCEDVRQEINGHFQFLGIFGDGIRVPKFPLRFMRIFIVNRWSSGQGSFTEKTTLMAPDGHTPVFSGKEVAITLKDAVHSHTSVQTFMGVVIPAPGTYWIEVSLDQQLRMRYPISFIEAPPPAQPSETRK